MPTAIPIPSAAPWTSTVAAPTAAAPIAGPITAASPPATISPTAVGALAATSAVFFRNRPTAEFARGDEEPKVRIVRCELSLFGPFVAGTVQVPIPEFERSTTDGANGLHDPQVGLGRRQLDRWLDLNHLGANDVSQTEFVVDVFGIILGYIRNVDRPLRLAADLARTTVDGEDVCRRHHAANVVDDPVHDVPDPQLGRRIESRRARHTVPRTTG